MATHVQLYYCNNRVKVIVSNIHEGYGPEASAMGTTQSLGEPQDLMSNRVLLQQ